MMESRNKEGQTDKQELYQRKRRCKTLQETSKEFGKTEVNSNKFDSIKSGLVKSEGASFKGQIATSHDDADWRKGQIGGVRQAVNL